MKYKPENVELIITHNCVEQDVSGFDEYKKPKKGEVDY